MRKRRDMTCEEFSAQMAQLVAAGEDIFQHPHVKRCKMHRALLWDLEIIARAARDLFPDVDPSDKLWQKIEGEIAPAFGVVERRADPMPGFRLISRVRLKDDLSPRAIAALYDHDTEIGSRFGSDSKLRAGRLGPPPHKGEGRR